MRLGEVAPEEELLANREVAVRDVRRAHVPLVVHAREPGVVGVHREDRARFDRVVAPPREVHRARNVVCVLRTLGRQKLDLLLARSDRPARPVVLVVVEAKMAARREDDLIVVAAVDRDVRPVDHRLNERTAVHEDVVGPEDGAVGHHRQADRPLQATTQFRLADPDRLRAVRVRREPPVDRHCRRRAVVVREVPLHAARDPRPEHADQGGLDDVLAVERLEARLAIREVEKMPAMFGQKPHLKPLVLKRQVRIRLVDLAVEKDILHGIRIDAPLRALVDAPRIEQRRLVISSRRIRREDDGRLRDLDLRTVFPGGGERETTT